LNSDLVGKFINIASRTAGCSQKFDVKLADGVSNLEQWRIPGRCQLDYRALWSWISKVYVA
jgi:hypothetical protein